MDKNNAKLDSSAVKTEPMKQEENKETSVNNEKNSKIVKFYSSDVCY